MSVRTYDPKEAQIFPPALCSTRCGKPYYSICKLCNLAYCFDHLKLQPHVCDTKQMHIVPTAQEAHDLYCPGDYIPIPEDWDPSPKGCFQQHPDSREICQLKPDGHTLHMRLHPNGQELECWTNGTVKG